MLNPAVLPAVMRLRAFFERLGQSALTKDDEATALGLALDIMRAAGYTVAVAVTENDRKG